MGKSDPATKYSWATRPGQKLVSSNPFTFSKSTRPCDLSEGRLKFVCEFRSVEIFELVDASADDETKKSRQTSLLVQEAANPRSDAM